MKKDFRVKDYITCNRKRSRARVHVEVCEKCRRMGKCPDYKGYIQPSLFPGYFREMIVRRDEYRRKDRSLKAMTSKSPETEDQPRQLALNL